MRWSEEQLANYRGKRSAVVENDRPLHEHALQAAAFITLPYPPSGNMGTRHAGSAHYLTQEHVDDRLRVLKFVQELGLTAIDGRLSVTLQIAPPDKRRRDLDNVAKVVLDALQHAGVYRDDCAIDRLLLERMPVVKGGAVCALVEPMQ